MVRREFSVAGTAATRAPAVLRRRAAVLAALCIGVPALLAVATPAFAQAPAKPARPAMQSLADDELADVRGADGIAFNLSHFSLTSDASNPLTLTYQSPGGGALTLSRLDLSRTDDSDAFADPYWLHVVQRDGLPDAIALDFPANSAGNQAWTLTTDFSNCDLFVSGSCTGTNVAGGTLQVSGLAMKGGGLTIAPSVLANTQGIAFGLATQLDIASLSIYSHGRTLGDTTNTIDTSDALTLTGIHLADVGGGIYTLADVTRHPGLINAVTDASGSSYLHLQIGWPTTADPVPAASLRIDNISFTSLGATGPVVTNLGSASIASMQLNYVDIKFRTGQ